MRRATTTALKREQRGVGLIEVLVAAVIIAIGLLGLAGLQTRSLQMNQSAYHRSQATYYAYNILDEMRMNREAATQKKYDIGMDDSAPGTSNLANKAVTRWLNGIETTLPMTKSGAKTGGSVEVTALPDDAYLVRVRVAWLDERWSEDAASQADKIRQIELETEL